MSKRTEVVVEVEKRPQPNNWWKLLISIIIREYDEETGEVTAERACHTYDEVFPLEPQIQHLDWS